jgi:ankyrin repeat protein
MSDPVWQMVMQTHQQNDLDDLWEAVFENDEWGVTNALAMLQGMGDVVDAVNKKRGGFALVHVAAGHASPQVLAELLNAGAEPGAVAKERVTALHCALEAGKDGNAAVLLAAGASATAVDSDGWGAAHFAARSGKVALVGLLRQRARATLCAADKDGDTPMHVAAELAKVGFIKALLGAGVDADAANSSGWTPLHTAATKGYADVARALLDGGASANATNAAGWTPLHSAAKYGHAEVARALSPGAHWRQPPRRASA